VEIKGAPGLTINLESPRFARVAGRLSYGRMIGAQIFEPEKRPQEARCGFLTNYGRLALESESELPISSSHMAICKMAVARSKHFFGGGRWAT